MSIRKTGCVSLTIGSGHFATIDDATKSADAFKKWLYILCEKRPDYAAIAIICISQNDIKTGRVGTTASGKRGRPKKVFLPTSADVGNVSPHLHIVLLANPCQMILKEIKDYFNTKFYRQGLGATGHVHVENVYRIAGLLRYILPQSIRVRTADFNGNCLINPANDFGLIAALANIKTVHKINIPSLDTAPINDAGFIFTFSCRVFLQRLLTGAGFWPMSASRSRSHCNYSHYLGRDCLWYQPRGP